MSHQGGWLPLHSSMIYYYTFMVSKKTVCAVADKSVKSLIWSHVTQPPPPPPPTTPSPHLLPFLLHDCKKLGPKAEARERELLLSRGGAEACLVVARHVCAAALRRCCCFSECGWCYNARESESNEYAVEASPCCRRPRGGLPLHRCHVHRRRLHRCRRPAPRHAPRSPAK